MSAGSPAQARHGTGFATQPWARWWRAPGSGGPQTTPLALRVASKRRAAAATTACAAAGVAAARSCARGFVSGGTGGAGGSQAPRGAAAATTRPWTARECSRSQISNHVRFVRVWRTVKAVEM